MNRAHLYQLVATTILAAAPQYAAEVRHLTLTEAVHLAISQNRALKIARLKVARVSRRRPANDPLTSRRSQINRTLCTSRNWRIS